jgi:hypothetical protein
MVRALRALKRPDRSEGKALVHFEPISGIQRFDLI